MPSCTFISADQARGELVSHVYDVTYGIVRDRIDVLLDDSIVGGTTLQDSLITIVARLNPTMDHHRLLGTPDPPSGLLRHRYVEDGRIRGIPGPGQPVASG